MTYFQICNGHIECPIDLGGRLFTGRAIWLTRCISVANKPLMRCPKET